MHIWTFLFGRRFYLHWTVFTTLSGEWMFGCTAYGRLCFVDCRLQSFGGSAGGVPPSFALWWFCAPGWIPFWREGPACLPLGSGGFEPPCCMPTSGAVQVHPRCQMVPLTSSFPCDTNNICYSKVFPSRQAVGWFLLSSSAQLARIYPYALPMLLGL